ncbi:MAG: 50S ribosomal protein L11 methyltransferase [Gammaproteobacteria bacterium]
MPWLQLRFTVERNQAEALSEILEELGAQAVTLQGASPDNLFDQIDERPTLWASTNITALFDAQEDAEQILVGVRAQLAPNPLPPHEASLLADQDWNRAWMDRFQPMRFGSRLWVVPSWHTPPQPDAVNLTLDPGMAFGTGTHPTTAMCLRWLDGASLRNKTVLDYGCGSGILAIAAVRLGALHVEAVDIDPQCLEVTRENAERNAVLGQIHISLPSAMQRVSFDVLVANILAGPLHELAGDFGRYVKPGGDLVLSGLLAPQAEDCLKVYSQYFNMDEPTYDGDWAMLHGTRT